MFTLFFKRLKSIRVRFHEFLLPLDHFSLEPLISVVLKSKLCRLFHGGIFLEMPVEAPEFEHQVRVDCLLLLFRIVLPKFFPHKLSLN